MKFRLDHACLWSLLLLFTLATPAQAADNQLTALEQKHGWLLLFDGTTTNGWMNSDRTAPRTAVTDHALNPHGSSVVTPANTT